MNSFILQNYIEIGSLANANGQHAVADQMFKAAVAAAQPNCGGKLRAALTLSEVGFLYSDQKQYKKAESCFKSALAAYKSVLGNQHHHVAKVLDDLGDLSELQGKTGQALQYYRRAELATPNHPLTFDPRYTRRLKQIAWLNFKLGRRDAAINAYDQALRSTRI